MTTVETRVVDPVRKHPSVDVSEADVNTTLDRGEENILVDEEIESCDGQDLEEQMINVALMESVVDSSSGNGASDDPESPRYGLRKRQRPGSLEQPEASALKPAATGGATATIKNGRLSLVPSTNETLVSVRNTSVPFLKQEPALDSNSSNATVQPIRRPIATSSQVRKGSNAAHKAQSRVSTNTGAHNGPMKSKNTRPVSRGNGAQAVLSSPGLVATSGAVPNPLSQLTPPTSARAVNTKVRSSENEMLQPDGVSSVPCPLPAPVPCPLPEQSQNMPNDKRVTIADPPVPITRNRIFSVDLDPSTFDFPDMSGDAKGDEDIEDITGANLPEDLAPFKRDRAFSFEFFTFGGGDDLLPTPPVPSAPSPDTAPLPAPTSSLERMGTRPRGDSIIFDPVSFQDGGIHEKNAIIRVSAVKDNNIPAPSLLADSRLAAPPPVQVRPQPPRPIASLQHPGAPAGSIHNRASQSPQGADNGQVATLPSALSIPDVNGNTSGTFQMELLNKDGRIGIYLPEARRARIARFHAKRKMRIWRKRIKYDCRKKLADSRPRIKGRFVKRSDMDE